MEEFRVGQPVKHKNKKLHEARFHGWSKGHTRVGIKHNAYFPYGVMWAIDWHKPENIETLNI